MGRQAKSRDCAICGRPVVEAYRPFCSCACADIDLDRWLSGRYAIAGSTDSDEDGAQAPPAGEAAPLGRPGDKGGG